MWPQSLRYQNLIALRPDHPHPIWLFDLDNTLHDASKGIFDQIHRCMIKAIQDLLDVDTAHADRLRVDYWRRYGATLLGMVRHHQICPHEFLARAHDFDVTAYIHHEPGLDAALARLPGQKIILTNAPLQYARTVLYGVGIHRHFQKILSIESMQRALYFRPKPSLALMQQTLARLQIHPAQCLFIDDTRINLKSAAQLGIRTILFAHPETPGNRRWMGRPPYVNLSVRSIRELSQRAHELL